MKQSIETLLLAALTLVGLIAILYTCTLSSTWKQRQLVRRDLTNIEEDNSNLKLEIDLVRNKIQAMQSKEIYQEHVIRDELGYIQPGDVILELAP